MARVTLQNIADRVGVSRMSVSEALRGTGRASRETRERILKVADELGYRPNPHAQSMKRGKSNFVGLLISSNPGKSHLFDPLLKGIIAELDRHRMQLVVREMSDQELSDEEAMQAFAKSWLADGMLVYYTHGFPTEFREILQKYRIRSVWINAQEPQNSVYVDGYSAARDATRRFIRDGLSDIVYFDLRQIQEGEQHYSLTKRYCGYANAMEEAGLTPISIADHTVASGKRFEFCTAWFAEHGLPEAVIGRTPEDVTTAVCAAEAMVPGSVPERLQAIGFSTQRLTLTGREISSLLVPMYDMGQRATQLLLQRIDNPRKDFASVVLPCSRQAGYTTTD